MNSQKAGNDLNLALEYRMSAAVNISFGNTYGSYLGTSLMETYLDDMSSRWKNVICIGSGNEGNRAGHTAGNLTGVREQLVEETTITIPSTASKVMTVGAYDALTNTYADFSGRGGKNGIQKPDFVATGVEILTAAPGGGYVRQTGTSFAVPFVTGAAALLTQYGIVDGNDPYLYGEKVKAYLRRGATPLPGIREYPDERVGYGTLCVTDSIPLD